MAICALEDELAYSMYTHFRDVNTERNQACKQD